MKIPSPTALTRKLISFDTINPPGNESECAHYLGKLLEDAGFQVSYDEFKDKRTNLVARLEGAGHKPALCFSGHLDTVPLGGTPWTKPPFGGELEGDRIYGRGASDMKSGVAAMVCAALRMAAGAPNPKAGILLVLTAGEEAGCEGAYHLARQKALLPPRVGALIVGEPTGNYPLVGHKGAMWVRAKTEGVAAHGSMPHKGVNAIYKAVNLITRLQQYEFNVPPHSILGEPTINIGTISGGTGINIVPDEVVVGIDIRTIPPQTHERLLKDLQAFLGQDVTLEPVVSAESIATDPDNGWVREVFEIMTGFLEETPLPRAATYFTDASALAPALAKPPTLILGPGEPDMAHKTDEFCLVHKIEEGAEAYFEIARRWCGI